MGIFCNLLSFVIGVWVGVTKVPRPETQHPPQLPPTQAASSSVYKFFNWGQQQPEQKKQEELNSQPFDISTSGIRIGSFPVLKIDSDKLTLANLIEVKRKTE